jgi:hypothetical protein
MMILQCRLCRCKGPADILDIAAQEHFGCLTLLVQCCIVLCKHIGKVEIHQFIQNIRNMLKSLNLAMTALRQAIQYFTTSEFTGSLFSDYYFLCF